ncbi:MAG TPA: GNAT family N-acetyltransferase [Edaphocola sp.]|nr:GNAT family N-acetyltransferase [Edaphocola sp.]
MIKAEYIKEEKLLAQLPVFYQPWYLNIFGNNWDVLSFKEDGVGLWIFPYFIEKKFFLKLIRPPFHTPYYGPYLVKTQDTLNNTMSEKALRFFIKNLKDPDYLYFSVPEPLDLNICSKNKFNAIKRVTYLLDLTQAEETLFVNMNSMRRRNIRKAERELVIKESDFDIDLYYQWIKDVFGRQNKHYIYSIDFLKRYVTSILENNGGMVFTAYNKEGIPLSMSLVLNDKERAYYILGANNPQNKHSAAATAIMWEGIKAAKRLGCKQFDFEGSVIPEIANFYSKFGAEKIDYFGWERNTSLLWQLKRKILK